MIFSPEKSYEEIAERIRIKANPGREIVFVNGCFDVIHPGHVSILRFAASRSQGRNWPFVVVALNSDESVARLKGHSRPIFPLRHRMDIVQAFRYVNAVCSFSEDTPIDLIRAIRPDFIVKGGEYRKDEVVGHDIARVLIAPMVPGFSTTETVRRVMS